MTGLVVLGATLTNLGVLLFGISQSRYGRSHLSLNLGLTIIVVAMATIAAVGAFETLRKRGDAVFQELSDELQWYIGRKDIAATPRERPLLEARVALRSFSVSADLPLVPGHFGGAVYAALNVAAAVAASLLFRLS